jgi:hypothetical protein
MPPGSWKDWWRRGRARLTGAFAMGDLFYGPCRFGRCQFDREYPDSSHNAHLPSPAQSAHFLKKFVPGELRVSSDEEVKVTFWRVME